MKRIDAHMHFWTLAFLVATVQGGSQALARSLFARMIPRHKSSEFFAFFSVFERYAGVLGPAIFAFVVSHSGSGRMAILEAGPDDCLWVRSNDAVPHLLTQDANRDTEPDVNLVEATADEPAMIYSM